MKTKLLVIKGNLKKIYSTHGIYITPTLKFLLTLTAMLIINGNIGFMSQIDNPLAAVVVAALCSVLPVGVTVLILCLIILAHLYKLSMEIAIVSALIFMCMFILYYRFSPKDSYVLLLVPMLFFVKMPFLVPLFAGLVLTPVSLVSVTFGTIVFYILQYTKENAALISNEDSENGVTRMEGLLKDLLGNKEMMVMIITFAVVMVMVYCIRRLSVDYARTIALVVGGMSQLIILVGGSLVIEVSFAPVWLLIVLSLLSIGIVYILDIFVLSVDYQRTEYTQFEDDQYYYYVKAVPKVEMAAKHVNVKHINVQKAKN